MKQHLEKSPEPRWYEQPNALLMFAVLIVAILIFYFIWITSSYPELSKRGQFGDTFGAANALFSGLAFAGVIVALFMQRRELELQRKELELQRGEVKLTRDELQRAAAAQQEQAELMHKAAHLNALSTLVESYTTFLTRHMSAPGQSNTSADLGKLLKALRKEVESGPYT